MCYYCHVLKNNPHAPNHQSANCLDRSNAYSKVPKSDRTSDKGKPILASTPSAAPTTHNNAANLCCICLDQSSNMAFIPCGHVTSCDKCAPQLTTCPLCRQLIQHRQKIFLS